MSRLRRMHDVLAEHVASGHIPGLVALVARRGEVHADAIGAAALQGRTPMRRDTIFRITSMTKPITAAATMISIEECRLRLDEPVDRWLPELAGRRVLRRIDGPLDDTVPARRPITVRDCLTFRCGLGMIAEPSSTYPIQEAVNALGIVGFGPPNPATPHGPDEWMRRLGTLPLMYQPGERWQYNLGSSVLGVLIARATGRPFETFLRERLFLPLGMQDTTFIVPEAKLDRLATCYKTDGTGALVVEDDVADSRWGRPPAFADGGAGLVSTADDYLAFARMLLNQGRHGGERILSRPSVELMTTDQLTSEQRGSTGFLGDGRGWGFGVSTVMQRDDLYASPGRYGWDGGYGTSWANDPREDMVAILMTQRLGFPAVYGDFWTLAYQAVDD